MRKNVDIAFLLVVYLLLYLVHLKITLVEGSDDTWFADQSNHTPFIEWICMRYTTWSGRLFPDTMLYVLLSKYLWLWRILNPLFLVLLTYGILRVAIKDVTRIEFLIGMAVLGYINNSVLNSGFFWITGSINYLWPIAFGLIAMIPFGNNIFDHNQAFSKMKWGIFFIFGFLASLSNEQVALCLSAFSLLTIFSFFLHRRKINKMLLFLTVVIISGTSILIFAPGNKLRWVSEVHRWFPGYDEMTLKSKLHLGIIWIYKQLFFEMRNIILLLAIIVLFIYFKEKIKMGIAFISFSVMLFILNASIFLDLHIFYNFELINTYKFRQNLVYFWKSDIGFFLSLFPYIFWTIFGSLLVYLILYITKNKIVTFFIIAASVSTMVVMFFSPTIYASGTRTLVVGSVLLSMVIVILIREFKVFNNKLSIILLGCLPFLNLLKLFVKW